MSVQLNNEKKIIIVDFERVDDFLHKRKQANKLFLVIKYMKQSGELRNSGNPKMP